MPNPDRFEIDITPPAARSLARLAPKFADAALQFIDGPLSENPMRVTKPLHGEFASMRSGYVGTSYRVLVKVDLINGIVHVVAIAHRADVYRSR